MDALFWSATLFGLVCAGLMTASVFTLTRSDSTSETPNDMPGLSLVFSGNRLIDADDPVWSVLPDPSTFPTYDDVRVALLPFVPNLPLVLDQIDEPTQGSEVSITVSQFGAQTRLKLSPKSVEQNDWFHAKKHQIALAQLQPAIQYAPDLIWSVDQHGSLIWGNDTFGRYASAYGGDHAFADFITDQLSQPEALRSKRINLTAPELHLTQKRWLEVTVKAIETGMLYFASGIDAVVQAEAAQQSFVQTLSKTFANLTTGLAIFDRDRRLVLFNPALVDQSGVSAEFLSARPAMFEFFDKLRDHQIMPEPKNYDDWRERMARLVVAASDDRFRETWNLSTGQTLDVTGRPYPDGAIAFLFNDITAEVSLTRGFRTELETMQSVIDAMEDAVAVFNQQGILTLCNAAYSNLWKVDPDTCISESSILEATQAWKSAFHPSPVWAELRDFVTSTSERASWDSELRAKDGREVICRIDPICYGATLVRFCHHTHSKQSPTDTDSLQIVSA